MTYKTSRFAAVFACLVLATVWLASCSTEPQTYLMRSNYSPVGTTWEYTLTNQRAGSVFVDDVFQNEFETKAEASIKFETKKINPDGSWLLQEDNLWSWDEPVNDSGKVTRKTRKYSYLLTTTPQERITDIKVLEGPSYPGRLKYIESYYKQMIPVYPDQPVKVGDTWTQKTPIVLPDSSEYTGINVLTIKGTARKNDYDCLIIESKAKGALPVFDNPETEVVGWGVDWVESNELLYFAINEGIIVHSESKSRLVIERESTRTIKCSKNDKGEMIDLPEKDWTTKTEKIRQEMEETSTYSLKKLERQ
ncbi:MAG: hypothetical protein R3F48_12075 [Candidatus Zixiibacteriota bacterium]